MKSKLSGLVGLALAAALLAGCSSYEEQGRESVAVKTTKVSPAGPATGVSDTTTAPAAGSSAPTDRSATPGQQPAPDKRAAPPATEPKEPPTVREKAKPGVGAAGKGLGKGLITTPISVYFDIRERLAFDIVKHNMDLFKASEGRAPKSHEEFMQRIIKENQIALPLLPEGHRYVYDPKAEELMVEHPAPE